ncbi:MAG: threonyl-tRNA synthetase, partial [Actinomycetia bacterium]|nr:threonyl-tRNA synthetase [Actinomycetes bacterium]
DHQAYVDQVRDQLKAEGFRVESEDASDKLGARIRNAKLQKIPYVLVVGDDDVEAGTVGVNQRGSEQPERGVAVQAFVERLRADVIAHA